MLCFVTKYFIFVRWLSISFVKISSKKVTKGDRNMQEFHSTTKHKLMVIKYLKYLKLISGSFGKVYWIFIGFKRSIVKCNFVFLSAKEIVFICELPYTVPPKSVCEIIYNNSNLILFIANSKCCLKDINSTHVSTALYVR